METRALINSIIANISRIRNSYYIASYCYSKMKTSVIIRTIITTLRKVIRRTNFRTIIRMVNDIVMAIFAISMGTAKELFRAMMTVMGMQLNRFSNYYSER